MKEINKAFKIIRFKLKACQLSNKRCVTLIMKKDIIAVCLVTFYLIVFTIISFLEISVTLSFLMYFLSPALVIWMVISVLKSKTNPPQALKDGEEWGYQDVSKEELGVF